MAKKLKPIHPGAHLREDFVRPLGLSSNALAHALEVTPARINEILRERRGISAESWLNLQSHYDIQCAEDAAGQAIKRIRPCRTVGKAEALA